MLNISISIPKKLNEYLEEQIALSFASSKAELIMRALIKYKEDEFMNTILQARREMKDGKGLTGDLDELVKRLK